MESAVTLLENLLELNRTVKVSAIDKVLFCIYRGVITPRHIMDKLSVSKGNLANYCKSLTAHGKIRKEQNGTERGIAYSITEKGTQSIQKILKNIDTLIEKIKKSRKYNDSI